MNAYEEYKTIIMAKSNTATAARARQEAVYGAISMYVYIMTSVREFGDSRGHIGITVVINFINHPNVES